MHASAPVHDNESQFVNARIARPVLIVSFTRSAHNARNNSEPIKAAGSKVTLTLSDSTVFMRIPPGEKTKDKFIKIMATDFTVGDSVFARGKISEDRKTMPGREFYVMSKGEIADKKDREREAWRTHGIAVFAQRDGGAVRQRQAMHRRAHQ